jgi:hypothetical protein
METTERVARAICFEDGRNPDSMTTDDSFAWECYIAEAQAAIDAMQPDIAEADRKAREECAAIAESWEIKLMNSWDVIADIADDIRKTIK